MEIENEVYYKLLKHNGKITIACIQWFDEYDYDQRRFVLNPENDEPYVFKDEEEAVNAINDMFNEDEIDPRYLKIYPRYPMH